MGRVDDSACVCARGGWGSGGGCDLGRSACGLKNLLGSVRLGNQTCTTKTTGPDRREGGGRSGGLGALSPGTQGGGGRARWRRSEACGFMVQNVRPAAVCHEFTLHCSICFLGRFNSRQNCSWIAQTAPAAGALVFNLRLLVGGYEVLCGGAGAGAGISRGLWGERLVWQGSYVLDPKPAQHFLPSAR